jgi:hypothetical protein
VPQTEVYITRAYSSLKLDFVLYYTIERTNFLLFHKRNDPEYITGVHVQYDRYSIEICIEYLKILESSRDVTNIIRYLYYLLLHLPPHDSSSSV